jgi:hypothetical protein
VKPATRRWLLWSCALAATLAAVAWVGIDDDKVISPAPDRRHAERRDGMPATAKGALPTLRLEQLESRVFAEMKADLFAAKSWQVPLPVVTEKPKPPLLPFVYAGRLIVDSRTTVFLSRQDSNQLVHLGDVVDKTWRVDDISATSMKLTYLPLNESQTLSLGAAP